MPVSRTVKCSRLPSPVCSSPSARTVSTTSPVSVNLTALLSRFSRIWRSRVTSPSMRRRHLAFEDVGDVQVLLGRARADQVERRLDALAQVEGVALDVHAPGLDLREVEDVVDDRQQRVAAVADGGGEVALLVRRAACRAAARSCRSRRSSACGSRGSSSPGRRSWLRWRLRPAARASCVSLNSRAFWIAITAWSAKVLSSAISLSLKGFIGTRATAKAPMPLPCQNMGTYSCECLPSIEVFSRKRAWHIGAVQHVGIVKDRARAQAVARARLVAPAPGSCGACTRESSGTLHRRRSAAPRSRARAPGRLHRSGRC